MALSAEEQKELLALRAELKPPARGLSNAEAEELFNLRREVGPLAQGGLRTGSAIPSAPSESEDIGTQVLRTGLKALPMVGGVVGGIMGTAAGLPTGPGALATGVGGAALGTAAGESYKQLGENYFFGEKKQPLDAAKEIAWAGGEGAVSQLAGNAVGKVGGALMRTAPAQNAIKAVGSGLAKTGEALTGVSKKAIETYAKHAPEISTMSKVAGGDVQVAADTIRKNFNNAIQSTRRALNAELEAGLKEGGSKTIKVQPILDDLAKQQEKINPQLYPEELSHLDDVIRRVQSLAKDGDLSLNNAHEVKGYLQDLATGAYSKGGQIFQTGKNVARGSKNAAATARKAINSEAPSVAAANNGLSGLHSIEKGMNRNMLKEGETASSLLGAGGGANAKNAQHLKRLGDATGTDMLSEAEKLNAMKSFGDAPVMPWDMTGKAVGRMATGYGVGYAVGGDHASGMTGAALTSPLAMKGVIRAGRGVMHAGNALGRGAAQQLIGRVAKDQAPIPNVDFTPAPPLVELQEGEVIANKGREKWVQDGFKKVLDHADGEEAKTLEGAKDAMLKNPKIKDLLAQASDLKPGSKAMSGVVSKINQLMAKGS